MKKCLAWVMTLVMAVQCLPMTILASDWTGEADSQAIAQEVEAAWDTATQASMDDATAANLNSIWNQLETTGMVFYNDTLTTTSEKVLDLSAFDSSYLSTTVVGSTTYLSVGSVTVPAGEASSFRWDIIGQNPSMDMSLIAVGIAPVSSGSTLYLSNSTSEAITYDIILSVRYSDGSDAMNVFEAYSGLILNAIQFSNPVNMMFYQQGTFRDNGTVFLGYDKSYAFYGYGDGWSSSYASTNSSKYAYTSDTPVWILFDTSDQIETSYQLFEKTANAIFANGNHSYSIQTDWTMSGFEASGETLESVWMEEASIWPYADSGNKMGVASYYSTNNFENDREQVDPSTFYYMDANFVYNTIPIYFYLNKSTNDFTYQNTLEMVVTGDGIPTSFYLEGTPHYKATTATTTLSGGTVTTASIYQVYTENPSIAIYDVTAPTVTNVYVNDGFSLTGDLTNYIYSSGQYVPITLEFSEPVDGYKLSVTINGVTYSAEDLHMYTTSATQTAWYQVQDVDSTSIVVSGVSNIADLMGNTTSFDDNGGANWSCDNITMESALMRNAVQGSYVDTDTQTVTLTLNQDTAYQTKYADYHQQNVCAPFKANVIAPDGSVYDTVQFYFSEVFDTTLQATTLIPYADLPDLPIEDDEQTYTVEITAYETAADTEGFRLWWYDGNYGSEAKIQLESVAIVYPDDDSQTLSLTEDYRPLLSATLSPTNLTCDTGSWSSSNEAIATIDENGQVSLTGSAVGTVNFTYTADNGTDTTSDDKSATTYDYTVNAGSSVSLLIPTTFQNIVVRQNNATTVFWSSNVAVVEGMEDFEYLVEVYPGYFETDAQITGTAVYTSERFSEATDRYVFPTDVFTNLSVNGLPAYTIRVSIPATNTTQELSALAWVTVNAQLAGVTLTPPTSLYMTDGKTASIGWDITNYISGTTQGTLTITRIEEDTNTTTTEYDPFDASTGTYTFTPASVDSGALKDTYMFTASVVNNATDANDMDGFIMYVYNDDALDIELGGTQKDSTTLSNLSTVSGGNLTTETQEILALREELALIEYVGINYGDYSWSMLKDGIAWDSSSDVVSINYKQGSLYENIDNFTMETYLPQTQMLLSSVTDGTATITATHANTSMSDSVEITVDTLRDEFYLFQISPMVTTELTYTDGKNNVQTVTTNSDGYLALYEPDGIASDVTLRADDGGTVYLGTIYQADLISGERDSTLLQLYPLNSTTMRQVAQLDLYLTNPDGSPFVGSLTLRGGVYVDEVYRSQAQMQGNGNDNLKYGNTDQTVDIPDGYLTVNYDSTQFVDGDETLTAKNDIQYILELSDIKSDGTEYYPQLVYSNATLSLDDIMYSADSIITLEDATDNENTPFISNQYFLYEDLSRELDIQTFTGRIGPNQNYQSATVYTNMMLWGESADTGYTLYMVDENGYQPDSTMNTSETYTYEFSSIPLVRNTLTLTEETMTTSGWIAENTDRGMKLRLSSATALVSEKTMPWRVLDMTDVEDVLANADVSTMVSEMLSGSALGTSNSDSSGNAIISGLMGFVTPFISDIGGSPFNIIITPTENNAVFDCLIWGGYDGMGLDEVDYSDTGLALESDVMNASLSVTGISDLVGMAGGDDDSDAEIPYDTDPEPSSSTGSWGASFEGQLQGYYQGEITYNFTTGKWEMHVLEGGFTAGFQGAASFSVDASASGIPLFLEIELGGAVQLDFKMATRYQEIGTNGTNAWADTVESDTVNDYLTTLRLLASAGVFGGIGFDYSVISFKIGPYGEAAIDSSNLFLTRDYLDDETQRNTDGQYLEIEGEIGAKMEATFLIFSTEVIFGSGSASYAWDWGADDLSDYWAEAATYGTGYNGLDAYSTQSATTNTTVTALTNTTALQSRDYLSEDSVWVNPYGISLMSLDADADNGLSDLQSNANPSSYPVVSDDGYHLLYISDAESTSIYDARVYATNNAYGSYLEGSAIDTGDGYGDSNVTVSGDDAFAAAAWVRLTNGIDDKDAGDEVTTEDQVMLLNSTEIMVSLWDGSNWTSHRLTENGTPDIAPVVATNDYGDAIVAWRSVYSGTGDELMTFDAQDYIMYSVYSNGTWSEAKTLYNGSTGSVMGIDAQILDDGTAMVAYTIDRDNTDGLVTDYEIAYSIIGADGDLDFATVVTSDNYLDENPQIVVANFGDAQEPDDRFVLGWYNNRDDVGDVRLLAVNSGGAVSNAFPESLAQITATTNTTISSDFQFARMDNDLNDLENLTILWEDIIVTATGEADYSVIRAVSFTDSDNNIGLTAVANLAELPSGTLLDHFDAYVSGTNQVKAVIQATEYDATNSTAVEYSWDDNGTKKYSTVYIPSETTMLYTATETFENRVEVQAAIPDYQNLALNAYNAIQFSVFNGGLEDIDSVKIEIDKQEFEFANLDLAPNDSTILTCWYKIGGTVTDTTYNLTATFDSKDTKTADGDIYLDYPDLGISQMTVVQEENGIRTIRMSLYNSSIATLAEKTNRSVEIAFYDGADFDTAIPQTVSYDGSDSDNISFANDVLTITGDENLKRIDDGVFMVELTYDVGDYVENTLGLDEIPDYGVRLYADVNTVDNSRVLPELNSADNVASISFDSLVSRTGQTVTMDIDQATVGTDPDDYTTATITLKNNSLQTQEAGGAMIVSLLDETGDAIEQQQVTIGEGIMTEEAVLSEAVTFSTVGTSVSAIYGELEKGSNELLALTLAGQTIQGSDFVKNWDHYYSYVMPSVTSEEYVISIIPTDPTADVVLTVNNVDCELTDNAATIELAYGQVEICITINSTEKYYISVYPDANEIAITLEAGENGIVSPDSISVDQGTKWGNIMSQVTATPDTGYVLDGWYVGETKIDNVNQTFDEATIITAKFVEKSTSEPIYISSLMPTYLTLTPKDSNMTDMSAHWSVAEGADAVFTLEVDEGEQYWVNYVQYQISSVTQTIYPDENGVFTIPWSHVQENPTIWATTDSYYTATFKADSHSTMADVTYYGNMRNLYETLEDLRNYEGAITALPVPALNTGYRLAADTDDEPRWTDENDTSYTTAKIFDNYWQANKTFTVNTVSTSYASWNIAFQAGNHGTVSSSSNGTYTDGYILPVPTPIPDTGYQFSHWTDRAGDTVTLDATTMAIADNTYTANFELGTWNIDFDFTYDWLYDITDIYDNSPGPQTVTYGEDAQFKLVANEGYTVPDLYYTVDGGFGTTLVADSNGIYTIPGEEILGDIQISEGVPVPKTEQTLTFAVSSLEQTLGDGAVLNTLTGAKTAVTYTSSNQDVATVNNSGQVTLVGAGTASIIATAAEDSSYQSASTSYDVTVHQGTISLATDQMVVFDASYADLKQIILTVGGVPTVLTQSGNKLSGYPDYTFNGGIVGTVQEGSIELTLYKEFLATLPEGAYSVGITTYSGDDEATITATIPTKTIHTVTIVNQGDGTSGTVTDQAYGTIIDLTPGTLDGYTFTGWSATGGSTVVGNQCMVLGDGTITANWSLPSSGGSYTPSTTHTITTTVQGLGTVSPSTAAVKQGSSQTFTFTPHAAFVVSDVLVNGVSVGAVDSYTIPSVSSNLTLDVVFAFQFTDVADTAYYYNPVLWAVENGITSGYSDGTFRPATVCTRAQAVVFLYRAAGQPEVSGNMMFTDVSVDSYYYDAVLWAVQNGITQGTTATTFNPDANCTRSQIVTFLWNNAGKPIVDDPTDFTDVGSDAWYADAVRWALSEGVTAGTTATTFSPNDLCNRGQIVTFLYRNLTA